MRTAPCLSARLTVSILATPTDAEAVAYRQRTDHPAGCLPAFELPQAIAIRSEGEPMWVLVYIFSYSVSPAATSDRTEWRLTPSVVFQEFSSEERCLSAKAKIQDTLKDAGTKLKGGLDDLKRAGVADPSQIIIAYHVECLPK